VNDLHGWPASAVAATVEALTPLADPLRATSMAA